MKIVTRDLSIELAPLGITINNVAPGAIETPINTKLLNDPVKLKALLDNPPLGALAVHLTLPTAEIDPAKTYTVAANTFEAPAMTNGVDTGEDARKAIEAWLVAKR